MIHIFVGTKAQLIKMMPIVKALDRKGINYNFINTGQHAALTSDLIKQFDLRQPDVFMREIHTNINNLFQAMAWTMLHFIQLIFNHKRICRKIFKDKDGICLIHGDTLSTLISLFYAKRCGKLVAHVEAGLRSFKLFDPFPEEIIRLITMYFSNILFAPSDWAFKNLREMGYYKKATNIGANTSIEAVSFAVNRAREQDLPRKPYVIFTIHRVETIYSRLRLMMVIKLIERIARERMVLFLLHEPTRRQLKRFDLLSKVERLTSVETLPLQPYIKFVNLLAGAEYVVTDGGSIQEECYYLNKPCMIIRSNTERIEGLGENVFLADFDEKQIDRFFEILPTLKRKKTNDNFRPSDVIIDHIFPWA